MTILTRGKIIEIYRQRSLEKGHPLTTKELKKDEKMPSAFMVYKHFDSIQQLRKCANLLPVVVCYDLKNKAFILKTEDGTNQAEINFCKLCTKNPETCGKNVKDCMNEVESWMNYE